MTSFCAVGKGPIHRISDLHPAYLPLQYPLLFPYVENGWYPEMQLRESDDQRSTRVQARQARRQEREDRGIEVEEEDDDSMGGSRRFTLSRYASYRIQKRVGEFNFNTILHGGRLFCRYVVDIFASIGQQRLRYISDHQSLFRAACLNNLTDAIATDPDNLNLNEIGQRVILPSSYTGGPRNTNQAHQDSMSLARRYRKVDAFLTMTTNPLWEEIVQELEPGQTAYDRPDLVAPVFQLKRKALLDEIYNHGIFGMVPRVFKVDNLSHTFMPLSSRSAAFPISTCFSSMMNATRSTLQKISIPASGHVGQIL